MKSLLLIPVAALAAFLSSCRTVCPLDPHTMRPDCCRCVIPADPNNCCGHTQRCDEGTVYATK